MNRKMLGFIATLFMVVSMATPFLTSPLSVKAVEQFAPTPYSTVTAGIGGRYAYSAPAYDSLFILNKNLKNPSDLVIGPDQKIYIADTGNKQIMVYNPVTTETSTFTTTSFVQPTGIFVDTNNIYVADPQAKKVFKFDLLGNLVSTFGKPTEVIFGEEESFAPTKIAVDARGNMYITSDGNANGLIQLNSLGEFVRYFGMNTVSVDIGLLIRRAFMTDAQKELLAPLRPKATTNLAIDHRNLIYTIIYDELGKSMKKLNVEGDDIFTGEHLYYLDSYVDITVDAKGYIYLISDDINEFAISVHDRSGDLLFRFGYNQVGSSIMGVLEKPTGLAVDEQGNIWVLDSIGNNVQVFVKTQFANTVMGAIDAYEAGHYDESMRLYNEVITQNNTFVAAYKGRGLLYQRNYQYEEALDDFRIADYKIGYSEVFWEYRDAWISDHFGWIVFIIGLVIVLRAILKRIKPSFKSISYLGNAISRWKQSKLRYELGYFIRILKDPADVIYEIKYQQKLRWGTAVFMFMLFVIINILSDNFIRGNLFKPAEVNIVLSFELLRYGLLFILLAIANQLMSSLQNGEGFFRDVFMVAVVSMAPFILFKIPLDLLSNVLTYNEQFIFDLGNFIIVGWSIFNVLYSIREVHNYRIGELIVNIALTLFTAFILVLLYLVLSVLFGQVIQFILGLATEVFL